MFYQVVSVRVMFHSLCNDWQGSDFIYTEPFKNRSHKVIHTDKSIKHRGKQSGNMKHSKRPNDKAKCKLRKMGLEVHFEYISTEFTNLALVWDLLGVRGERKSVTWTLWPLCSCSSWVLFRQVTRQLQQIRQDDMKWARAWSTLTPTDPRSATNMGHSGLGGTEIRILVSTV